LPTRAGNALVCVAVKVERKLHNVTNYFLVSLSFADLLVSLVVMPCSIVQQLNGQNSPVRSNIGFGEMRFKF